MEQGGECVCWKCLEAEIGEGKGFVEAHNQIGQLISFSLFWSVNEYRCILGSKAR